MTSSKKRIALLFTVFTILCVGFTHPSQLVYKLEALLVAAAAFRLFYERFFKKDPLSPSARDEALTLALIVLCGTLVRLMIAREGYGNYDSRSWEIAAEAFVRGQNIYTATERYMYSPVWFWTIGFLEKIHGIFPQYSLSTCIRFFLTLVDAVTLLPLLAVASRSGISRQNTALLFYMNPVSFLLTGYHAQFENLALLFLFIGLWGFFCREIRPSFRTAWLWFFSTVSFIVKHNIFYEVIVVLNFAVRRPWVRAALFLVSCAAFLASFLLYREGGSEQILRHVFLYSSYPLKYGVGLLTQAAWPKFFFILGLFLYPFFLKSKDLLERLLSVLLFFLVFTTGVGVQYFVLPIALGALRPARGFFIYSAVTTAYLLGSYWNLGIAAFAWVPLWTVWVAAAYWWMTLSIHSEASQSSGFPRGRVHAVEKKPRQ